MTADPKHWLQSYDPIRPAASPSSSPIQKRIAQLTMPSGALEGLLSPYTRLVAQWEEWQFKNPLRFSSVLFAGDHSLAVRRPISAFPQVVTRQMVLNFLRGGACQSVLARKRCCSLTVVDVGVVRKTGEHWPTAFETSRPSETLTGKASLASETPSLGASGSPSQSPMRSSFVDGHIPALLGLEEEFAEGCHDPTVGPSLGPKAAKAAFEKGYEVAASVIKRDKPHAIILGEMGIGNSTASGAIAEIVLSAESSLAGRGTGISEANLKTKAGVIAAIRQRFEQQGHTNPWDRAGALYQEVGGFEHAALAGAALAAAQRGVFIILDGVIVTAALAPLLDCLEPLRTWVLAGHVGAEPAHRPLLKRFGLEPLLDLGLRLGEGSGALLAAGLLLDAHSIATEMATFEHAGVSSS